MDLYQIRYFVTIAQTGNFTKAAERLFVSQPSLSAGIKKLERELGVMLFERGGRRVLLTPAGQFFLAKAEAMLKDYQLMLQDIQKFKEQPTLRLGTLHTLRGSDLAELMGAFRSKHGNVAIELHSGNLENLEDWLEGGYIDLAITWLRADETKDSLFLFSQQLMLAVFPSHPFAQRSTVPLMDLNGQPYIERIHCEFWRACPQMFESAGVEPHIVYSANSEEWVISLIKAGLGMSIMPKWRQLTNLIYVPIDNLSIARTIGLKWRNHHTSEAVEWFRIFASNYAWQVQ